MVTQTAPVQNKYALTYVCLQSKKEFLVGNLI